MSENLKKDFSEYSSLKEEIKSKEFPKKEKIKEEKALRLFGNDINDKKPKYYGKTKALLYIGDTPIVILGEDSKLYYHIITI